MAAATRNTPSSGRKVRRGQRPLLAHTQSPHMVLARCKAQRATLGDITWAVLCGAPEALAPLAKDRPAVSSPGG